MINDIISNIKRDLSTIDSRENTLKEAIVDRVSKAQELYLQNIEKNYNFLLTRNNLRLLKTLKREQQRKEQESLLSEEEEAIDD